MLLIAGMLTSFVEGCDGKSEPDSKNAETEETSSSETAQAESGGGEKDSVELKVFINGLPNPSDWTWGQDPVSQQITEDTGISFDVQYASDTDNTEITTMLASGEKLPDIIVTNAHGPVRPLLIDQGFVLPLNELADEYNPEFFEVLPKDMDKVYQEADGNFYCIVDWYGDEDKYEDQLLNSRGSASMTIKEEFLEEIGNPEIKTMDDYISVMKEIKEKHPEINNPVWDQNPNKPWLATSLLKIF